MSGNDEFASVSLAVASSSLKHRKYLENTIRRIGIDIVLNEPLSLQFVNKLKNNKVDVVLLDIDEGTHEHQDILDQVFDSVDVPVIFNDVSALTLNEPALLAKWYGKLLTKISELTGRPEWDDLDINQMVCEHPPCATPVTRKAKIEFNLAENVWVLGASHGGPEMLKQFLSELSRDLPVAFILAQHLGANFNSILAEQLNRTTVFHVMPAKSGHILHHHEVIVVPVNERMLINPIGAIELQPVEQPTCYSPSIDRVTEDIALRYTEKSGAIIFSGMGDDGMRGAEIMKRCGGQIWAQDIESCFATSMPDSVRSRGIVSEIDNPKGLANKLQTYYS
ncbi:MAG: chemotaxis protein CheB [Gammaproteobacteria bacterium]|nr:chemotaxis protein CheB [Gammaproteobacteria bacterium]